MSPAKKVTLSLVASLFLAAVAVYLIGARDTFTAVWQIGWGAFLATGVALYAQMACQAAAWARLERQIGFRPKFRTLFSSTIVAMAGNIIMPSAHLGGEPAKILYAGRNTGIPYTRLSGTVLLCKYIEAMSFVVFFAAGSVATLLGLRSVLLEGPGRVLGAAIIVLTVIALILSGVMWISLARRWTPLSVIVAGVGRIGIRRAFFHRLRQRSVRMELWAARVFREERHAVLPAFLWYLVTHVLMFIRPFLFFYLGFGIGLNVAELSLIFLAAQLMLAIQFMPSGLGTLDGGIVGVIALAHMLPDRFQCAAFLLCIRFWDATVVLLGMTLAARTGIGLFKRPRAMPAEAAPAGVSA